MIDPNDLVEAQERRNVALAKWTILHDGNLLPVTNLYDSEGEEITNPMHASVVVAFDADCAEGNWITIKGIDPGELWSRHNAEVPNGENHQH